MSAPAWPGIWVVLFDLLVAGTPVWLSLIVALRLARGAPPRVRYVAAVSAFLVAAFGPVVVALQPATAALASESALDGRPSTTGAAVTIAVWVVGAVLLAIRELAGHVRGWRSTRRLRAAPAALERGVDWPGTIPLRIAPDGGPRTVGWMRPVVVLPVWMLVQLEKRALIAVTQHERSHARWRDPAVHGVLRWVRALLWPAIPLWLLERCVRDEREASADAAAVERLAAKGSRASRRVYADALLSVAERCAGRGGQTVAAGVALTGPLERRLLRLLDRRAPAGRRRLTLALAFVAAGSAAGLAAAQPAVALDDHRSRWTLTDHLLGANPTVVVVNRRVVVRRDVVRRDRNPPPVRDHPRRTAR